MWYLPIIGIALYCTWELIVYGIARVLAHIAGLFYPPEHWIGILRLPFAVVFVVLMQLVRFLLWAIGEGDNT